MVVSSGERKLVVIRLGDEKYGVDICLVREINLLERITWIPMASDYILGVLNLRNQVIAIVDLKRLLGISGATNEKNGRIMITEVFGHAIGFLVDGVDQVLAVTGDMIQPPASITGLNAEYLNGIVSEDQQLIALLDVERIMSERVPALGQPA